MLTLTHDTRSHMLTTVDNVGRTRATWGRGDPDGPLVATC